MTGSSRGIAMVVALGLALPAAAEEPAPAGVDSSISRVTVYSDRALVTRSAAVTLPDGRSEIVFSGLPGWVDDGSVRVDLKPRVGRVVDVQVRRDYLARATDRAYHLAEADVAELAAQVAALDDELKVLAAQEKQIESIRAFSLAKLSRETAVGDVKVESFAKVVDFVSRSLRNTAQERRATQAKRRALVPELTARQRKLTELQGLTQLEQTTVIVTLERTAGAKASVELTYMLPGATWEPAHELRTESRSGGDPQPPPGRRAGPRRRGVAGGGDPDHG